MFYTFKFSIMKLPLDFQKFFVKNIQKIKNGLRIICYAPHHCPNGQSLPPRGSHEVRRLNGLYQKTSGAPHQSLSATASPRGEALKCGV